jgi:arginine/lysine/ornithine decarboxylase
MPAFLHCEHNKMSDRQNFNHSSGLPNDRSEQLKTGLDGSPLLKMLLARTQTGRDCWHMPGHDGGAAWPAWFARSLAQLDVTELPDTDDINHPTGPAEQAMVLAAQANGAAFTRFFTSGATTALYTMLALASGPGDALLVSRSCHRSVLNAAALLDLTLMPLCQTGYPWPDNKSGEPRLSLFPQATLADVIQAVGDHPRCRAVLLTSPDYYGCCADLSAIARFLHRQGILLLVDEAHGAHFPYDRNGRLPQSAMASGADACVQSGHKTLPVLTGGAMLHIGYEAFRSGILTSDELDRLLPAFQTSSPSFPIAASLDYARTLMEEQGDQQISVALTRLQQFKVNLPDWLTCQPLTLDGDATGGNGLTRDPLRLVLTSRSSDDAACVSRLAQGLAENGIDIEFADLTRLVLIPSLWQKETAWQKLSVCLENLSRQKTEPDLSVILKSRQLLELEAVWRSDLPQPEQVLTLREALLSKRARQQIPLARAAGCIVSQSLVPYPPGIALVRPGERLDQKMVDFICLLLENNINMNGVVSGKVQVFA